MELIRSGTFMKADAVQLQVHEDLTNQNSSEVRTLRARVTNPCRSFRMRTRNFLTIVLAIAMIMAPISTATAADLTWSGAGDGTSWNDPANWGGTAPADLGDILTIDTTDTLTNVLRSGGGVYQNGETLRSTVNLNAGTIEISDYFGTGRSGVFNIGDGVLDAGSADAIVNLTAQWELNRHDSNTYYINILADGELNATGSGFFQTYNQTNRNWNINIDGGLMTSEADWTIAAADGPNNNLLTLASAGTVDVGAITVQSGDIIDFADDTFTSFNANFGGSFADLAAVSAAIGTTFTTTGGAAIIAVDNLDGSYRVGVPTFGPSETATWIGGVAGNWNEGAKWSTGTVPFYTDSKNGTAVVIDTQDVTVSDLQAATSLELAAPGQLSIATGGALTVNYGMTSAGALAVNGGALTVNGGLVATSATTIGSGGTLTMDAGSLADVTVTAGNGTIASDAAIAAGNLTIADNGTLVKAGAGTISFSGLGTIGTANTAIKVSDGMIDLHNAAPIGVTTLELDGGTFNTSGTHVETYTEGLDRYGYHINNDNLAMNLDNNGGMMGGDDPTTGPNYNGHAILTDGPGDRGLDFNGDGDFKADGVIGQDNDYSSLFLGYIKVDATTAGDWSFWRTDQDDATGIWLDLNQDGVFESSSAGLGSNRGEQLAWNDGNEKKVNLDAGYYMVAFTHREGGGGSRAEFQFQNSLISKTVIKPTDAAQDGIWNYYRSSYDALDMSTTNVVVTNSSNLVATTDTTATFGELALANGVLTVSGAKGGTTFNSINSAVVANDAVTGVVSNEDLTLNGTLNIGDRVDLTLSAMPTGGIVLHDDATAGIATTIRAQNKMVWDNYTDAGTDVALTHAGTSTLQLLELGATDAANTTFTAKSGTLEFSGANALGGSTAALNLDGGTIKITGNATATPSNGFRGSIFEGIPQNDVVMNLDDAEYEISNTRVPTGSKENTVLARTEVAGQNVTWDGSIASTNGDFGMFPGYTEPDSFAWAFSGQFIPSASGAHNFRWDVDDRGLMYLDFNGDGTFQAADKIGSYAWSGTGDSPELVAGQAYNYIWMGQDYGGGQPFQLWMTAPGGAEELVDSTVQTGQWIYNDTDIGAIDLSTTNVNVTNDSTLDLVTSQTATLGNLNFDAASELTTNGAAGGVIFASTNINTAGPVGFNTLADAYAGPINFGGNAATIVKTGDADLVLDAGVTMGVVAGTGFDVQAGRLIATAGSLGDNSTVGINGGEAVLVTDADVTFDNAVASTGGTLSAGGANAGPVIVTLANTLGSDVVTLNSGNLLVRAQDDYTLNIDGNVNGSGDMTIGAASPVVVQGTTNAGVITIDGSLETKDNVTVRGLVANDGGVYAATGDNRNLIVTETLTLNSGIDMSTATLNVDGADVKINNGALSVGNSLGVVTPVSSVDVSNGGGLVLNGHTLTTERLDTTGIKMSMNGTGSFIATGDVAIAPAGGPDQVELSGGTLTINGGGISYAQTIAVDAPAVHYSFDEAAGSNTAVNTGSDASFGGAVNGTITFETPSMSSRLGTAADLGTDGWLEPGAALNDHLGFQANSTLEYFIKTDYAGNGTSDWHVASLYGGDDSQNTGRVGSGPEWWWGTLHDGKVGATGSGGLTNFESNTAINDDEWHHIVMTRDGTNFKVYIDGVLDKESTSFTSATDGHYYEEIGRNQNLGTASHLHAAIDELAAYDTTLSAEQVLNHYQAATASGSSDSVNLPDTHLVMTDVTTLDLGASDITLGTLTVNNAGPETLTFTGSVEKRLKLTSTTFATAVSDLTIDASPNVNLGVLNLTGTAAPVINKTGDGALTITAAPIGYTGGATYNVNAGMLVLGDSGLLESSGTPAVINVSDGAALKLSSTIAAQTYNETITLGLTNATILAGMADSNSATSAVVTLPSIPTAGQSVTLGTTDAGYTLEIAGAVNADSLALGGVGTVKLTSGGSVNSTTIGSTGTINVAAPLTVADSINLGGIEITDDAAMQIVGSNLAAPTGTVTLNGTAPEIWAGSASGGAGELVFDFSSGTLDGWNVGDNPHGPNTVFTSGTMPWDRGGGNLGIKTDKSGIGDGDTGILRSDPFTLYGGTIEFQIAGGAYGFKGDPDAPEADMLSVTLERLVGPGDWEMVKDSNGARTDSFSATSWDTSEYNTGELFRIGIYDTRTGSWGKVGMDDMVISHAGGAPEGVALDMPNLNVILANTITDLTLSSADSTATLGDLTMGANTNVAIVGVEAASFNNVSVNPAATTISGVAQTTIRGKLATAGGTDLTSSVDVAGNLTMAAGSSTSITGGTLTADSLTHAGGTNTIAAGSTVAVTNLNVTGGTLNAAPATLTVSNIATIGEDVVATSTSANDFSVSGSDVLAARTLTLNGGSMTLEGSIGLINSSIAPTGEVSHYAFDGTTDDTGSLANTAGAMTGGAGYAAGKFGQAMSLSGDNADYFDTNQDAPYDFQNGSVTFALWAQLDADGWNDNWESLIAKGEGTTWRLARNNNNQDIIGYGYNGADGTADLTDGQWHQFIVRADQSTDSSEIFFDGVSIATGTASLSGNESTDLFIGNNSGSTGRSFGGLIDDVYVYDRWLNDTEVAALYANDYSTGKTVVKLQNTTVATTVDSTVTIAGTAEGIILGGVAPAAGTTLTIDSTIDDITVTNMTLGGGSQVMSSYATNASNPDAQATFTVTGTLTGGESVSELGDFEDVGKVGLTMGADSTYNFTLGGVDSYVEATGAITLEDGMTINITGTASATPQDVKLLYTYSDLYDIAGNAWNDMDGFPDLTGVATTDPEATSGIYISLPVGWGAGELGWLADQGPEEDQTYLILLDVTGTGSIDGDATGDLVVDEADMAVLLAQFGSPHDMTLTADFNGDGYVDMADFVILRANWGAGTPVPGASELPSTTPEPATMTMLALGAMVALRRRRRKA
jgi:hypothetical protein